MINLDLLSIDPKQMPAWISKKYRKWIRSHASCFTCGQELIEEKEDYTGHHHRHGGGKYGNDALIAPICLICHNLFHFNEPKFNREHNLCDRDWERQCIRLLTEYLLENKMNNEVINILGMLARSLDKGE